MSQASIIARHVQTMEQHITDSANWPTVAAAATAAAVCNYKTL